MAKRILPQSSWIAPDFVPETFGRLTTISSPFRPKDRTLQEFRCQCGTTAVLQRYHVTSGHTSSCGCLQRDEQSARAKTHGLSKSRAYKSWQGMIYRCYYPNCKAYDNYGGRGISVFPDWLASFEVFYAYVGECPPKYSIDRIDVNGNYEPGNVRWATSKTQANNMRTNRLIEHDGESKTLSQWADSIGVSLGTLWTRLNKGWPVARALSTPLRGKNLASKTGNPI